MYIATTLAIILGIFIALLAITILILRQKSALIFGIYPSKGVFYRLKYYIALLLLKYLRDKFYHRNEQELNESAYMQQLDKPQDLTDNPESYDVVSFMGANEKGAKLMVTLERRRRGVLKACLYIWLPEQGLLCSPNLPDMVYFTTNGEAENVEFRGCGFHIYPEENMKLWRIKYEGQLRQVQTDKLLSVELALKFSSAASYFNYNRDLSAGIIADSVARESWNDAFYKMLKNVDQILEKRVHYEQNGSLEGVLSIKDADAAVVKLQMKGFRDHSFGTERCLSSINRYVYFALFLEDGTSMVVGNLSQPSFFLSSLKVGYVCTPDGVYQPITHCNFELYSYGEKGTPPQHQNFIVHTAQAKYFVQIKVDDAAMRYVGADWQSKVYNQFVSCTINGLPGQGLTEYLYRNSGGRPLSVSCNDPQWFQQACKLERSISTGENLNDSEDFFF